MNQSEREQAIKEVTHGINCKRAEHVKANGGYMHDEYDESPYIVDGLAYCGRCHHYIGRVAEGTMW